MSVTIRDVARLAGVSVATVSRVLNASAVVQPDTRQRVLHAAEELRFHPNNAARSLSMQRTHALGVILPDLYGEFFSELLRGMDQTAQRRRHHLLVSSSHHEPSGLRAAVRAMQGRVDGLLVMAPDVEGGALLDLLPRGVPTVLLNGAELHELPQTVRSIAVDNYEGARAMTRHLVSLGHRRIGFIAGSAGNVDASAREEGHRAGLRDAHLPCRAELCVRGDFSEQGGWRGATELIALPHPPTAIFCANDAMAIGALSALRAAGVDVPTRMGVVGFVDIPVARFLYPPLTSVRVGIAEFGERAVTLLLDALSERAPPGAEARRDISPTEIVVRASCGPRLADPAGPTPRRAARARVT